MMTSRTYLRTPEMAVLLAKWPATSRRVVEKLARIGVRGPQPSHPGVFLRLCEIIQRLPRK